MPRTLVAALASLISAAALTAGCSDTTAADRRGEASSVSAATTSGTTTSGSADGADPRPTGPGVAGVSGKRVEVVAIGDIACAPGSRVTTTTCRQGRTARLTKRIDPEAVLALGDLQYEVGALRAFRSSYANSWGDLKSITYPIPGNHEYRTDGAEGYYTYFQNRQPGSPGYYAFDLGRWRAFALNGNCSEIDCDKEAAWLVQQLEDTSTSCALMTVHFPRYSSGEHGSQRSMRRFYRIGFRHGVDLMLAGHDHHYERFRPMNHRGDIVENGMVQFVSGGGGKSHYAADGGVTGSAYVEDDTFGVLRLVLRPDSYRYGFRGIDGSRQDNGTRSCV